MRIKRSIQLWFPLAFVTVVVLKFATVAVIWAAIMAVYLTITTWNKVCGWLDKS